MMSAETGTRIEISHDLIEAIRTFPAERTVEHCNQTFTVSPFDFYGNCPRCGTRIKLRSLTGECEIEDVFDAVLEWMIDPAARAAAERRQAEIVADKQQ